MIFGWDYTIQSSDRSRFTELIFGIWKDGYLHKYLITLYTSDGKAIPEPKIQKSRPAYMKRFSWIGNLTKSYAAFRLSNVNSSDQGFYGCKVGLGDYSDGVLSNKVKLTVKVR